MDIYDVGLYTSKFTKQNNFDTLSTHKQTKYNYIGWCIGCGKKYNNKNEILVFISKCHQKCPNHSIHLKCYKKLDDIKISYCTNNINIISLINKSFI